MSLWVPLLQYQPALVLIAEYNRITSTYRPDFLKIVASKPLYQTNRVRECAWRKYGADIRVIKPRGKDYLQKKKVRYQNFFVMEGLHYDLNVCISYVFDMIHFMMRSIRGPLLWSKVSNGANSKQRSFLFFFKLCRTQLLLLSNFSQVVRNFLIATSTSSASYWIAELGFASCSFSITAFRPRPLFRNHRCNRRSFVVPSSNVLLTCFAATWSNLDLQKKNFEHITLNNDISMTGM